MMIGARTAAWAKSGGWVNPYVTDGLVAMWDGEWNAGGGVHDPNATTWKDLAGSHDLTINPSVVSSFLENSFNATVNADEYAAYSKDNVYSSVKTIEVCAKYNSSTDASFKSLEIIGVTDGVNAKSSGLNNFNVRAEFFSGKSVRQYWTSPFSTSNYRNGGSTSFDAESIVAFNNNVQAVPSLTYGSFILPPFNIVLMFSKATYNMDIFCLRLYGKQLTDSERSANYAIDKARFNLPDAT